MSGWREGPPHVDIDDNLSSHETLLLSDCHDNGFRHCVCRPGSGFTAGKADLHGQKRHCGAYRLLKPDNYDDKQSYPLVLFLHGAGERGDDNEKQLVHGSPVRQTREPQAVPVLSGGATVPEQRQVGGRGLGGDKHTQPAEPTGPMRLTLDLLDALPKEFSIDRKRIYVSGLSMGGYGTWESWRDGRNSSRRRFQSAAGP